MDTDKNALKSGNYVIVQRQGYTKLHKLKEHGHIVLGHFKIELDNCIGHKYYDTFQMKLKPDNKKLHYLEKVSEAKTVLEELSRETSGRDNRNITDDGSSQNLKKEEIEQLLQKDSVSSTDIVGKLVENSRTFSSKTEYSQEKYLKKKEKKYFEYISFCKPTIRLLAQMLYRQDPAKTLGMRIDDLSQLITHANIQPDGNYILYDSGTSGLITAAIMNAIGNNTTGKLIHMHPGNECQKNSFLAMQFPDEQVQRCVNVNLYSVLRCYYQQKDSFNSVREEKVEEDTPPKAKRIKLDIETENDDNNTTVTATLKKPCWQFENEKACRIMQNKIDGLILATKEHPVNIVDALHEFLKPGCNLVVYNLIREPLQDLYVNLKSKCEFICIRLSNNFMRKYQILPERTHPEVTMTSGGYILTAYKITV